MTLNRMKTTLALAASMCAWAASGWANPASLIVALSQDRLEVGRPRTVYLKVALTGEAPEVSVTRAPVNTAIVLDRSGSMAGEKLAYAKKAALQALDRLGPHDIVSVVAYDSNVLVLLPATRATDKSEIARAIMRLEAGSSTALYAGVSRGAYEVRKFLAVNRINRVILLSDGLANVGPSSPGMLAELGGSLAKEGISVSTIGLGLDYNEDLMTRLAMASDGNHAFVEKPEALASVFDREFGDLLSVVATNVEVHIVCPAGVRPLRILGREAEIAGRTVTVSLGQLRARQERYVLLEAEVEPQMVGQRLDVAEIAIELTGVRESRKRLALSGRAHLTFTTSAADAERSVRKDVMVAVVEQVANDNNRRALELRDRGQIEEARAVLGSNTVYLSENAGRLGSDKLREQSGRNKAASENLDDANWSRSRKKMREEQHQVETQQAY
jgi:Ca-activated chloride channel family protein